MVAFSVLAQQCAPAIALDLLVGLASAASGFDASAVAINGHRQSYSAGQAASIIATAADSGREAAVGLMGLQIATLLAHGVALNEGTNGCKNLAAAQEVIQEASTSARKRGVSPDHAVAVAFYVPGGGYASPEGFVAAVEGARSQFKELASTDVKDPSAMRNVQKNSEVSEVTARLAGPRSSVGVLQRQVSETWDVFGDYATREPAGVPSSNTSDDGVW